MISVEISLGEAMDRLSILYLKSLRVRSATGKQKARTQFVKLQALIVQSCGVDDFVKLDHPLVAGYCRLKEVNSELWYLEERVRELLPGASLSRDSYFMVVSKIPVLNDLRAKYKLEIDSFVGDCCEIKDYGVVNGGN
jgi:hypothetical protein